MRNRGLIMLLALFALLSFTIPAQTYAKYSSSVSGSDSAYVAAAVTELIPDSATLNGTEFVPVEGAISLTDMKAGDTLVYNFRVCNYSGTTVAKIKMHYIINIDFTPEIKNIPLEYTLTRDGSPQNSGTFGFDSPEDHSYVLTVSWDILDIGYANQNQSIELELTSTQSDN